MSVKENLTESLELLRTVGWIKGSYDRKGVDGVVVGYCSLGAIGTVNGLLNVVDGELADQDRWPENTTLAKAIGQLGYLDIERCVYDGCTCETVPTPGSVIARFNDMRTTRFPDVEAAFKKAIELAEAGETR